MKNHKPNIFLVVAFMLAIFLPSCQKKKAHLCGYEGYVVLEASDEVNFFTANRYYLVLRSPNGEPEKLYVYDYIYEKNKALGSVVQNECPTTKQEIKKAQK